MQIRNGLLLLLNRCVNIKLSTNSLFNPFQVVRPIRFIRDSSEKYIQYFSNLSKTSTLVRLNMKPYFNLFHCVTSITMDQRITRQSFSISASTPTIKINPNPHRFGFVQMGLLYTKLIFSICPYNYFKSVVPPEIYS